MPVNGGIVLDSVRYPSRLRRGQVFAVQGIWSGGTWSHKDQTVVQQYRDTNLVAAWDMVGVDIPAGQRSDVVILLRATIDPAPEFREGDILVFGEGRSSELKLRNIEIELARAMPVQVGPARYNALALSNNTLIVFHETEATLPNTLKQDIWIGQKRYDAFLSQSLADPDDYFVEFHLNHGPVTLKRLLDTLQPARSFALDAGQELLYLSPAPSGNFRLAATYKTFEPIVTVRPGSVRILLHPAQPLQMPLFVKPDEPLRVMVDVFRAASEGNAELAAGLLVGRFFSSDVFINRLKQIADAAVRYGDLSLITSSDNVAISVDATAARTLLKSIDIIPLRELVRTGTLVGIDLYRSWLRLQCEYEDIKEEWTLSFPKVMQTQMHGHIPRQAYVHFETRTLPDMARGRGRLLDIHTVREVSE